MKPGPKKSSQHTTGELHPRNPHRSPYDFPRLVEALPGLRYFLQPHPAGGDTVDFSNPRAVLTLNRALLKHHYGIAHWEIPAGFLCPPVPSRADYLHYTADLLAEDSPESTAPRGPGVVVLDIGTGANCVYPLIGTCTFGWRFVGTDIDPVSIEWARRILVENPALAGRIDLRLQLSPTTVFARVARPGEVFALSLCNPPFHASAAEAAAGTRRKLKNLHGNIPGRDTALPLNFGGRSHELWCEGGEAAFVRRMIEESRDQPELCVWFTSLVSKRGNLPVLMRALKKAGAVESRTLTMFAGQKQSRLLAWTFLTRDERRRRLGALSA